MRRLAKWWLGTNVLILIVLINGGGRPLANAHPVKRCQVGPGWY